MNEIKNLLKTKKGKALLSIGTIILLCICCLLILALSPDQPQTADPVNVQATAEAQAWEAVTQTALAIPTATLPPTETPLPTETPTPVPTLAPIILQGTGDSVVDVQKPDIAMVARIVYNGGSNFAVWNVDANGNDIDLLVNTIGAYQGVVPIDFLQSEYTARFKITASGAWQIELLSLASARRETIPGTFQGTGDDVIYLDGATPDLLTANATGSSNFIVWEYGTARDLLINEIAPYTGTVAMSRNTVLIVVNATGPWAIEIKTR